MKKKIVKIGTSMGFIFTKQEQKMFNMEIDDIMDIDDVYLIKKVK